MKPPLSPLILLLSLAVLASAELRAGEEGVACVPSGNGRLQMAFSGAFEDAVDWNNDGTHCQGGPRPDGDAVRLMFSRDDDALLVVIGITGLERGRPASGLLANLTIVRQGLGEFYGTLGADACIVDVEENVLEASSVEAYRIGGQGRCLAPIEAVAREGEVRVAPFVFTGIAYWPEDEHD